MGVMLLGCSGEDDHRDEVPTACVDYDTVEDVQACGLAPCSFRGDVLPLLQRSCALGTACHAGPAPAHSPSLGAFVEDAAAAEIDLVHAALVNVDATRAAMKLVSPNDPASSFLMAKMEYRFVDGESPCPTVVCGPTGCGVRMPQGLAPLSEAELAMLRAWIRAGAKND